MLPLRRRKPKKGGEIMQTKKLKLRRCRRKSHKHCPRCRRLFIKLYLLEKRIDHLQRLIAKINNSASIGPVSGVGNIIVQTPANLGDVNAFNESDQNAATNTG
jgi:hypothetical protein